MSNPGVLDYLRPLSVSFPENNVHSFFRKCQSGIFLFRLLRKSHPIFLDFIGYKSTHFSQISQTFLPFSSLSKNIRNLVLSRNYQNAQYEIVAKTPIFANDLAIYCISKSKNDSLRTYTTAIFTGSFFTGGMYSIRA